MARFSSACNTMTIDAEAQPREKECNRTRLQNLLRKAGLRPTQQRLALAGLLFGREHHHFSAEELHDKALSHNISVSQATIYNTLHQFTRAGLLREVPVDGARTYFDTNTRDHHHYYLEDENRIIDIPDHKITIKDLPDPPHNMEIARVDVVIRVRSKQSD
jgi:Fur family iron response transcriptional regulator